MDRPQWTAPQRPALYAEQTLVTGILRGEFPAGSPLPAERELAARLGVTRPTLREALQRLERDGWVSIQHGKPTRVTDYLKEGGLNVLSTLVRYGDSLPEDFIPNLLQVRLALAPAYAGLAVQRAPQRVLDCLEQRDHLPEEPQAFAVFDWQLHHALTIASGNPVFTLILNGFAEFYIPMAAQYFATAQARAASREFYQRLSHAAQQKDASLAEACTLDAMRRSMELWNIH